MASTLNQNEITSCIIHIARKFYQLGNISVYSLLKDSGYFEVYHLITESAIRDALVGHTDCVLEWKQFSEDKRTSGWHLIAGDRGSYEVRYLPPVGGIDVPPIECADEIAACAAFIKHEIEDIRTEGKQFGTCLQDPLDKLKPI